MTDKLIHLYDIDGEFMAAWYGRLPAWLAWKLKDEMNVNASHPFRIRFGVRADGLGGQDTLIPPGDLVSGINATVAYLSEAAA